jgi:hypothetical protein
MATNVEMSVKDKTLILKVDLTQEHGRSTTGKTIVVGTTHGFKTVSNGNGEDVMVSLNVNKRS